MLAKFVANITLLRRNKSKFYYCAGETHPKYMVPKEKKYRRISEKNSISRESIVDLPSRSSTVIRSWFFERRGKDFRTVMTKITLSKTSRPPHAAPISRQKEL